MASYHLTLGHLGTMMAAMAEQEVVVNADVAELDTRPGGCIKKVGCGCLTVIVLTVLLALWLGNSAVPFVGYSWNMGESFHIGADQVVTGNMLYMGESLHVEGTLDGNLTMMGEKTTLDGTVNGDMHFMGNSLTINGTLDGDLSFMGEQLTIHGTVTGDVSFAGNNYTIGDGGSVGGDVEVTGNSFDNQGSVEGTVSGSYDTPDGD